MNVTVCQYLLQVGAVFQPGEIGKSLGRSVKFLNFIQVCPVDGIPGYS
jgi:hypothetical protein